MPVDPARPPDWTDVRLHVVTGKGGTGKTTLAAALALALAAGGRRTLLIEVEGRQGIAQLFDCPPLPYAERRVAVARGGGEVYALAVDVQDALLEYLQTVYHLGRARWALDRLGVLDFVTTIAPGLRDVFLTGKICQTLDASRPDGVRYDAVVVDAPPTGRVARFLNVNEQVAGLARVGPVRNQAESIMEVLRSAQTAVHVVTLLEEMPTQETVDVVAELGGIGLPVGGVLINMVRQPVLTAGDLTQARSGQLPRAEIAAGLAAVGLPTSGAVVDALTGEALDATDRFDLEATERAALASLGRPTYELAWLAAGIDLGGLYELAAALTEQGFGVGGS
ncbi:MAG: ArsA-related P-loop ATPase [Candidatus Nanopelagicales bacterium]